MYEITAPRIMHVKYNTVEETEEMFNGGKIIIVVAIIIPSIAWERTQGCLWNILFISLESKITHITAPIASGIITENFKDDMPSSIGSYNPKKIISVEELRPGTIKLSPQKMPHTRKPKKFLLRMSALWFLKKVSAASIATKPIIRDKLDLALCLDFPASIHKDGSVPIINPTNAHITSVGFFASKNAAAPDNPIKPRATPNIKKNKFFQYIFKFFTGFDKTLMIGWYIPKATQSVPPLIPGIIAPKPTSMPSRMSIIGFSKLLELIFMKSPCFVKFIMCIQYLCI